MGEKVEPHLNSFILYVVFLFLVIIGIVFLFSKNTASEEKQASERTATNSGKLNMGTYKNPPKMEITPNKQYRAVMETSKGSVQIELFAKETPQTVNNFAFLAKNGYYDKTRFHRIVKDFMIQTGDPQGDGTGGPGYTFPDEKITRDYTRGIVAMANRGPDTNGSQFFIIHKDTNLPKNYVIFGIVTEGMDVVDKIAQIPTVDNGFGEKSKPTEDIVVEKISIAEK